MLQAVRFKNFIKFQEEQLLEFNKDGVYLFVGENNSGKSSVLEAVRRCMDIKSNFTFSMNVPNKEEPTYIICDFSLPSDTRDRFEGHNRIVTSFVHIPDKQRAHISAKVVLITGEGDTKKGNVYVDIIFTRKLESPAENAPCPITAEEKDELINELKMLPTREKGNPEKFLVTVSQLIRRYMDKVPENTMMPITFFEPGFVPFPFILTGISTPENTMMPVTKFVENRFYTIPSRLKEKNTLTESILSALSEHVVFTFPMRALGSVQWSKSSNLRKGYTNYTAASERCEIIRWFSEKRDETSKADEIFTTLTGEGTFKFYFEKKTDGKDLLMVEDGRGDKFNVLKCPEGILEAKDISLMLSYEPFRTLLLEEPDRGMHPQMIHRLRSIILPAQKNKTIIIVSHNTAFISPMLFRRTFKFCKLSQTNGNNQFQIVNIGNINMSKMPRIPNEIYANVLFAKKILFVEGHSDVIFIRALIAHILNPETDQVTERIFDLVSKLHKDKTKVDLGENWTTKLEYLLTSLDIVSMDGHPNKDRWHRFCERAKTSHMFLLDADAVTDVAGIQQSMPSNCERLAKDIHKKVVDMLSNHKINYMFAEKIANILMKKFLQNNLTIDQCENFTDQDRIETIQRIVQNKESIPPDQQDVSIETLFEERDVRLYGKVYSEEIKKYTISRPNECVRKINETFFANSTIAKHDVKMNCKKLLKKGKWNEARKTLEENNIFVWRDGSLEDAVLDTILATNRGSAQSRTDEIFRKYLAFYSLKINLLPERFHQKGGNKLYIDRSDISTEDIQRSIELVLKFCSEDSDIVHFLHFLTMYTK